jgi:hypothetical protein
MYSQYLLYCMHTSAALIDVSQTQGSAGVDPDAGFQWYVH